MVAVLKMIELIYWRDVRVVDGGSLENCCGETHRGFESLSLRSFWKGARVAESGSLLRS